MIDSGNNNKTLKSENKFIFLSMGRLIVLTLLDILSNIEWSMLKLDMIVTSYNSARVLIWWARKTLATVGTETMIAIFVLQII